MYKGVDDKGEDSAIVRASLHVAADCNPDWLMSLGKFETRRAAALDAWHLLAQMPSDELTPERVSVWYSDFLRLYRNSDETRLETSAEVGNGFTFALFTEAKFQTEAAIKLSGLSCLPQLKDARNLLASILPDMPHCRIETKDRLVDAFDYLVVAFMSSRDAAYAPRLDRAWKSVYLGIQLMGYHPKSMLKGMTI